MKSASFLSTGCMATLFMNLHTWCMHRHIYAQTDIRTCTHTHMCTRKEWERNIQKRSESLRSVKPHSVWHTHTCEIRHQSRLEVITQLELILTTIPFYLSSAFSLRSTNWVSVWSFLENLSFVIPMALFSGGTGTIMPLTACFSTSFAYNPRKSLKRRRTVDSELLKDGSVVYEQHIHIHTHQLTYVQVCTGMYNINIYM